MTTRPHGTRKRYQTDGCRCDACRTAAVRYNKWLALNRGTTLTDAAPVIAHVKLLRDSGMGVRRIAKLAGVSYAQANRLAGFTSQAMAVKVRVTTADAILALQPGNMSPKRTVDPCGTVLRLRALVAIGYTQTDLASRIGWTVHNLSHVVLGRSAVWVETRDKVAALYDELAMIPGPSNRSRLHAQRRGWLPPLALDDDRLDDPDYVPDVTVLRSAMKGPKVAPVEDIAELLAQGVPIDVIAQRLDLNAETVSRAIRRMREAS